jgi:hypothetical protein
VKEKRYKGNSKHNYRNKLRIASLGFLIILFVVIFQASKTYFSTKNKLSIQPISYDLSEQFKKITHKNSNEGDKQLIRTKGVNAESPGNAWHEEFTFIYTPSAFERLGNVRSIVPSLKFNAVDKKNQPIKKLYKSFTFSYNYSDADLKNIKENTLAYYRYDDQSGEWDKIPTELNTARKIATAQSVYLTRYALMGELIDTIAPTTYISIEGNIREDNKYEKPIKIELFAKDNEGGFGVAQTIYGIEDDWEIYESPFTISESGNYTIKFQTSDNVNNLEKIKTMKISVY